jgi:hypothetical protein
MAASVDWSSLPSDLVNSVADCLLATNDIDYYMDLRAVCSTWRSATTDARNNPDERFQPSRWIVVDEVSYSPEVEARTRLLVNTATGRILRKDLPMLRGYYVVTTGPNGFFILADREPPHATCILNPFTGYLLRFVAPMVTEVVDAAALYGPAAAPTLILFCDSCRKLYTAKADTECFDASEDTWNTYPFTRMRLLEVIYTRTNVESKLLALMTIFAARPYEMLAVYPSETGLTGHFFLVESAGEMLIIVRMRWHTNVFRLNTDSGLYDPVKSIGNQAIFVGHRKCVSVNADKFPSIDANCIYYLKSLDPCDIYMYDLSKDGIEERVSGAINTLNCASLFDAEPSFTFIQFDAEPPFTIIQLLSSFTTNAWNSEPRGQLHAVTISDAEDHDLEDPEISG